MPETLNSPKGRPEVSAVAQKMGVFNIWLQLQPSAVVLAVGTSHTGQGHTASTAAGLLKDAGLILSL